jgi:hypothetical protein
MLLLRANVLAKGFSGCRPALVELLVALLNAGVHPVIPEKGSVGASGDLAPLAHLALVVDRRGRGLYQGERMPGGEALRRAGLQPLTLGGQGGAGAAERHPGDDGGGRAGGGARPASGADCRSGRRHLAGGAEGHPGGLRCAHSPGPAARWADCRRGAPDPADGRSRRFARRIASTIRGCRTPIACAACRRCMARCEGCAGSCAQRAGDRGGVGYG